MAEKNNKSLGLKVKVNCKGSNACSNLGIGNGNLNEGSCGGSTGGTDGDAGVCNSRCSAICEQIHLEQLVSPYSASRIGQQLIYTYHVTNVSGKKIPKPVVISSSLLGTIFVTDRGLESGETITIKRNYLVQDEDLQNNIISNVAFVAYGVPAGRPGGYNPGERISPVVTAQVFVNVPRLDVSGNVNIGISEGTYGIGLNLNLKNEGSVDIIKFTMDIGHLFNGCAPVLNGNPSDAFEIVDGVLTLKSGFEIVVGQKYNGILIEGYLCSSCCVGCSEKQCIFDYSYQAEGGAIIRNSVAVASNISNISNLVSRAVNSVKNISRR